jgi:hypothetical protein
VPISIIKIDLDLDEDELNQIFNQLESQGSLTRTDNNLLLYKLGQEANSMDNTPDDEDNPDLSVPNQDSAIVADGDKIEFDNVLNEVEIQFLDIARSLVDDSGLISRNILEGHLLYGELKLTDIEMYNLLNSLDNKGILNKVQRKDGTYYILNSSYKD